jgi:hypothetical protein
MNSQTEKQEFRVQVDQLCTIWTSSIKRVEAISQDEADKIALDMYNNGEIFDKLEEFVYVYDSLKETETMEIINGTGNVIIKIN